MNTIKEIIESKKGTYKYFTEAESLEAVKENIESLVYVNEKLIKTK